MGGQMRFGWGIKCKAKILIRYLWIAVHPKLFNLPSGRHLNKGAQLSKKSHSFQMGQRIQRNKWSPTFIDCCEQNVLTARVVGTWTRVTGKNSALQKEPLFPNGKTYSKNLRIFNFPWAHRLSFIFGNPCAYYFLWEPLTFFGNHHCIYCRNYWRCHIYQTILWTF